MDANTIGAGIGSAIAVVLAAREAHNAVRKRRAGRDATVADSDAPRAAGEHSAGSISRDDLREHIHRIEQRDHEHRVAINEVREAARVDFDKLREIVADLDTRFSERSGSVDARLSAAEHRIDRLEADGAPRSGGFPRGGRSHP